MAFLDAPISAGNSPIFPSAVTTDQFLHSQNAANTIHKSPHNTALQPVIAVPLLPPDYLFSLYLRKNTFEVLSAVMVYM
jgi:hypothetical protein